ncbi:RNA polymerase sigma factor [Rhodophyticola sp.]|jgi:RNA polymerase sigma-70 factor (ECF subfamily)|nr:RNA polymerase sigma factor [Roseicyclus sp.]MBO6921222.1 RNA polymerase sigma factor [Roseicyclus sp.]
MPTDTARKLEALLPDLRRVGRRLSRTWEDADDLVQDTLLRVWTRMADPEGGEIEDLRAYAFTALRNRARARSLPWAELTTEPASPPEAPARLACAETLAAIDALPADQAHLLRLRALEGQSYAEIAAATGLPIGTVTSRLARGRAALCEKMGLSPDTPVSALLDQG